MDEARKRKMVENLLRERSKEWLVEKLIETAERLEDLAMDNIALIDQLLKPSGSGKVEDCVTCQSASTCSACANHPTPCKDYVLFVPETPEGKKRRKKE